MSEAMSSIFAMCHVVYFAYVSCADTHALCAHEATAQEQHVTAKRQYVAQGQKMTAQGQVYW